MQRIAAVLLLASCLLLAACAPSQRQVLRAQHMIASGIDHQLTCQRADHCARDSALYALGSDDTGQPVNEAILLERGEAALVARINLIRAARERISIQTFIWVNDDAGGLVLDELVRATRRGVKVRILADQLGSFNNLELLARLARTHVNFRVRLYNPNLHAAITTPMGYVAGGVCCFSRLNQRMHNKLLLVDGHVGITGGRNYENKYFDWDPDFNFVDRDVLVAGPVAGSMRASFERFWRHPRAVPLARLRDVSQRLIEDGPDASGWQSPVFVHPERVQRVRQLAVTPAWIKRHFLLRCHQLERVEYYADQPGKTRDESLRERQLTARLMKMVAGARHEIVLQTPYLVISDEAQKIFRRLGKQPDMRILVSTNSLAATDSFAVYALAHKYVRRYLAVFDFKLYEFKPHPVDAPRMIAHYHQLAASSGQAATDPVDARARGRVPLTTAGMRLSLHAKSMVIDGQFVLIGSHNFDPRSDNYNTESGIIVDDADFAGIVRRSIVAFTRPGNSWVVTKREVDGMLGRVNRALAKLSAKLPIFDMWPFGYATSWQLNPGATPVLPGDPRFYDRYHPVGEFPEVALPMKTIYTRIITAFGAGFSGLL